MTAHSYVWDHAHEYEEGAVFRGPNCARCGRRIVSHWSWGLQLAEVVGGDPKTYMSPRETS